LTLQITEPTTMVTDSLLTGNSRAPASYQRS